ncbi:XRE family transcriptional regulator [Streptomyces sp. LBL]|uniref:RICIN domain-containing protein n=1 Tax=Streptomyces sp. LBL TaxID=2940562 RepID=UPI002473EB58|nr:XRE family transcriptional regulator [Streptomyces sp. LBL]
MKQLKERSGLTYRELEEEAARNGEVLARSTLADVMRRTSLPRPDVLATFIRACGGEREVGTWLDARDRIAAQAAALTASGAGGEVAAQPETQEPTAPRQRRPKRRTLAFATALTLPLIAIAAWGLLPHGSNYPGAPTAPAAASSAPADGWVTIHPARTPDLCLTDGRDRDGAYANAIAVQLPCAQATVPRTYLEPAGENLYHIQWHHPQEGKGCLTIMSTGPVKGMLEPRNDCTQATLFRLEPTAGDSTKGSRIRPANSSQCIGIADNDTTEGAEAIEEQCTGAADQRFIIRTS